MHSLCCRFTKIISMHVKYLLRCLWEVAEDVGAVGGGLGQGIPLKAEILQVR